MATNSNWTVVFDDKSIINQDVKNYAGYPTGYIINDSLWYNTKFANIWAIQYQADNHDYADSVEYRDETTHATWTAANLGDFQTQFIDKWDAAHLAQLQADWDNNDEGPDGESEADKIARLGARPTSYTS